MNTNIAPDSTDRLERGLRLVHELHVAEGSAAGSHNGGTAEHAANLLLKLLPADVVEVVSLSGAGRGRGFQTTEHAIAGWRVGENVAHPAAVCAELREGDCDEYLTSETPAGSNGAHPVCRTTVRGQVVSSKQWEDSRLYQQSLRPAGLYDAISSMHPIGGQTRLGADEGGVGIGILRAFRVAGAPDFSEADRQLLHAVHRVIGAWLWRQLVGGIEELLLESKVSQALAGLTPAQRSILPLLLDGATEAEIARKVFRSRYTVHDHARAIYAALGVRNRVELVLKLTRPDGPEVVIRRLEGTQSREN